MNSVKNTWSSWGVAERAAVRYASTSSFGGLEDEEEEGGLSTAILLAMVALFVFIGWLFLEIRVWFEYEFIKWDLASGACVYFGDACLAQDA